MKVITKIVGLSIIIAFCYLLIACSNGTVSTRRITEIEISSMPYKINYYVDEELDLSGLEVIAIYNDRTETLINDYEIIYSKFVIGENLITIKYQTFEDSFIIYVRDYEMVDLLEYEDYSSIVSEKVELIDADITFDSVRFSVTRGTDMVIVYDEENFVNTNEYGYEVAVDKFGYVVEKNTKVSIPKNGFVISAHGINNKKLKNVEVGDYVIYIEDYLFIYKEDIFNHCELFYKFLDIIYELDIINDRLKYNNIVTLLNEIIPSLNDLYHNFDEELASNIFDKLVEIEKLLIHDYFNHKHEYSYLNINYQLYEQKDVDESNLLLVSSYIEKLYYGGFRNTNTLVYYDAENYRSRNEYGYEVAVDKDNKVIDKGVLVELPEGGYILSGHGTAADYLEEQVNIGNTVLIADTKINVYEDLYKNIFNSIIYTYNDIINLINNEFELAIPHDYKFINELVEYLNSQILALTTGENYYNLYKLAKSKDNIYTYISMLYGQIIDYKVDKTRAMWYYPFASSASYDDTTLEGVCRTLDTFKNIGFNEIILLPFSGDYILYDSQYFYKYNKLNNYSYGEYGNDYLACFIEEAHKRDICVNAFTQTFRCFEEGSKMLDKTHYQVEFNGSYSEGNIYYYDICNDYVQDVLYNWYIELVTLYDFDKIEYDIIRYSASNLHNYLDVDIIENPSRITDPGYTEYSMNKFLNKYNLAGSLKDLIVSDKEVRKNWLLFKEEELIKFITRTTKGIKNINPEIVITAAVMNDYEVIKKTYLQDAKKWLELGIIDQIEPMVYSNETSFVINKQQYYEENFSEYDFRIGIGNKTDISNLMKQIYYTTDHGVVIFSSNIYLKEQYINALSMNHHFDFVSDISSKDEITTAMKDDLIDKIENFYSSKNNKNYDIWIKYIEEEQFNQLRTELNQMEDIRMSIYLLKAVNDLERYC